MTFVILSILTRPVPKATNKNIITRSLNRRGHTFMVNLLLRVDSTKEKRRMCQVSHEALTPREASPSLRVYVRPSMLFCYSHSHNTPFNLNITLLYNYWDTWRGHWYFHRNVRCVRGLSHQDEHRHSKLPRIHQMYGLWCLFVALLTHPSTLA